MTSRLSLDVQSPSGATTIDRHAPRTHSGWTTIEFSPLLLSNVGMLGAGSDVVYNIM